MVSKKRQRVLSIVMVSVFSIFACPFLSLAQNGVSVENGSVGYGLGVKGSYCCNPNYPESNRMELSLDNPDNDVGLFQADICIPDLGGNLRLHEECSAGSSNPGEHCSTNTDCPGGTCIPNWYEFTSRADSSPGATITEDTGCIKVRFLLSDFIARGSGPVAVFYFDVSQFAPSGNTTDLTLSGVTVLEAVTEIDLEPTSNHGQFWYYNCGVNQHCDDGIFCNGEEWCTGSWCAAPLGDPCDPLFCDEAADRCFCDADGQCNDGLWCTGTETCNTGTGNCQATPPCSYDGNPCTDDCDEGTDTCYECNAAGPWDACCQNAACSGEPVCNEEVTLSIGDGSGLPSATDRSVVVSLDNPSDPVSFISATICDAGDYLTIAPPPPPLDNCVVSGRAAGYECNCEEELVGTAAGCVGCGLFDPTGTLPPIDTGVGALFTLKFDVSSDAPYGQCNDLYFLTHENFPVVVKDENNLPLVTMPEDGKFCVPCATTSQCDDLNECTSEVCSVTTCVYTDLSGLCDDGDPCTDPDTCSDGECLGTDKCPNGDFCDGVAYCSGGTCLSYGDPCDPLTCDSLDNLCGSDDVRLIIAHASALPGESGTIDIKLKNESDPVSELHFDVCDADQRDWLHITPECTTTGRASLFSCTFNGFCADGGNECSPLTQDDDCTMVCVNDPGTPRPCTDNLGCKVCALHPSTLCDSDDDCSGGYCSQGPVYEPCFVDEDCPAYPSEICIGAKGRCEPGICDSCTNFDLGNGCVGVDITPFFPLDEIETGSGVIAQLSYEVDPVTLPPENNCADLTLKDSVIKDGGGSTLEVTPKPGRLCVGDYCNGNFDGDLDVDAFDVELFLADFGREQYYQPCGDPLWGFCNGDFDCDVDVDAFDVQLFLADFGREQYFKPCHPLQPSVCMY